MGEPPLVEAWLREFVETALRPREVDDFVRQVDDEILKALPVIAVDPTLTEELHASTRAHWRTFLVGLADEYHLALPPAAVSLSLSIARRHLDINVLLKVYRVANRSVFSYVAAHTSPGRLPEGLARDEALLTLWLRAERWIDDSIEQLIEHYTRERASIAEGAQARRAEAIEALVAGAVPTTETERVLGHHLTQWQTAFVLSASPTADAGAPLFDVAVQVCAALDLPRPLTTLAGSRELWGWVATPEEPTIVLDGVADLLGAADLHLAVGRSGHGPAAFRSSHLQAVATQRIGRAALASAHQYGAVELVGLIGNGELAREMVRREIGPLLTGARGDDNLRQTALAYLRAGQNVDTAAEQLFVHPNTVRYRMGRVEEQLGARIGTRATMLEICLSWLDLYGVDALT